MARVCAQPWERELRREIKRLQPRGLSAGPHRGGRTQLHMRWSDGSRSSVTITSPWAPEHQREILLAAAAVAEGARQGVSPSVALEAAGLARVAPGPMAEDPAYGNWRSMVERCCSPTRESWRNYGARGVMVDPRWREDFQAFAQHIGPRPSSDHSIDRIDPEGHYCPGNVRWALPPVQANNTRENKLKGGLLAEARICREQAATLLEAADRLEAEHRRGRERTRARLRRAEQRLSAS